MKNELKKIIDEHDSFLLTTHLNPDGDGIGSGAAFAELLLHLGKKVRFISPSPIPKQFSFLNFHDLQVVYDEKLLIKEDEVLIVLDTHDKERIGKVNKLLDQVRMVFCIDHHPCKTPLSPYYWIDSKACSSGAMIYSLFDFFEIPLNLEAAKGIYTSILCDTGRFSYASTTQEAHRIADVCIQAGVDPDEMYSKIFQHVTFEEIRMCARALQKMETYFDKRVVILQIQREDYDKVEDVEHLDLEYFLEFNKLIEKVECVLLLRELPKGEVRVSLRSKEINVTHILHGLGGGGHSRAAGLSWKGSLQEVKEKLLTNLKAHLHEKSHVAKM